MKKLSTGDDSTLGNYRKLVKETFGEGKALEFIEKKIAEAPKGQNEEVLADEAQMFWLLSHIEKGE